MRDASLPVPPPLETPLNWRRDRDGESEARARRLSAARILPIVEQYNGRPEIELLLALGEACPFTRWWECEIWLGEIDRIRRARS
jgi:hypothetical protein